MDPLSVSAAIIGLLSAAAKVTMLLVTLVNSAKEAPQSVQSVLTEVSDISACLGQLQVFLTGMKPASRCRASLIMVEQVVVILAGCVSTFSELEAVTERLKTDLPLRALEKLKWARREGDISKILRRLQASKSSLNLILAVLTCSSVEEAQASVIDLQSLVRQVLESNEDMSQRLRSLELHPYASIRHAGSTYRSTVNDDSKSISGNTIGTSRTRIDEQAKAQKITQTTNFGFGFEEDLQTSRVYQRIAPRHSLSSLPSSAVRSLGWSFLSGVSLADISNISVVSLPISLKDLSNPQHYRFEGGQTLGLGGYSDYMTAGLRVVRCLLLGPGQAGKSTITKQLRILHGKGFDLDERREARMVIYSNLKLASERISKEALETNDFGNLSEIALMVVCQNLILSWTGDIGRGEDFPSSCPVVFNYLWQDRTVRKILRLNDGLAFNDNLVYFMTKIKELAKADYMPTDEDILRSWIQTAGIHESYFKTDQYAYHFSESSGELSRRRIWPHLYNAAAYDCIWYVAAISGYNQGTFSQGGNQMEDAIQLFESLLEQPAFKTTPVMLFLNKIDVFKEKIGNVPIKNYFADFKGGSDYGLAVKYFVDRFRELDRRLNGELCIFLTNATDVESLQATVRHAYLLIEGRTATHSAP